MHPSDAAAQIGQFRTLIDHLPFFLWIKDAQSNFIIVNQFFADATGIGDPEQMVGKSDLDVWPADLAAAYRKDDAEVMAARRPKRVDEPVELDGHRQWIETFKTPIIRDGHCIGTVGFAFDITNRKDIEQKLAFERTFLKTLIQTIPDPIWLKDPQGRFLACNHRFESLYGAAEGEIVGKTDYDFVERSSADHFRANDRIAIAKGAPSVNEEWVTFATDGHRELWETTKTPMTSEHGDLIGVLGIGHDITDSRAAQDALAKQQHYTQVLLNISSSLINLPVDRFAEAIDGALARMAEFSRSDRAYIFSYDFAARTTSNTFEWCAPGVVPQIEQLQQLPMAMFPEWVDAHGRGQAMHIADVAQLPAGGLKDILEPQGIQSVLALPLMRGAACMGFVGFDRCRIKEPFGDKDRTLLDLFAVLLVNALTRQGIEQELRLASSVFQSAREGIIITDANNDVVDVNEAFTRITGYRRDEVIGRNPSILGSGLQDARFYESMWNAIRTKGYWEGEIWNRTKEGKVYAELLTISTIADSEGHPLHHIALFSDISMLKEQERALKKIAHYDSLTGLPNRVLLSDRIEQAMVHARRRGETIAILFLDLDGFKSVNDHYGHDTGDALLIAAAGSIRAALREGDTLARIGGDEFIAVLSGIRGPEATGVLLQRILAAAAQPVVVETHQLSVSASIGVTFFPQSEEMDADQLVRQADQAMYIAKQQGKNRYHIFDTEHDRHVRAHHETVARIQRALRDGELELHYQPKVDMTSGAVIGVEALIRWNHPIQGLLFPGTFMPDIEGQPIELDVGEWVVHTALEQIRHWQTAGLALPVSINVGAQQLQQRGFVGWLLETLEHHQVAPSLIEIELLESNALSDMHHISQVIENGSRAGIAFSLDDFGTGYSSLAYLRHLKVRTLKIDRSFVQDMLTDADDHNILKGTIALAIAFKRQVIAEGVESEEQGRELIRLGCVHAQGYGIAQPMPGARVLEWISAWQPFPSWRSRRA